MTQTQQRSLISASAMSASVCLISSLSSGGSGLGKPGGKRVHKFYAFHTTLILINDPDTTKILNFHTPPIINIIIGSKVLTSFVV
jgi:hypothetical protein